MKIIRSIDQMQKTAELLRQEGKTIGFVPTLGYFHEGHLSLIRLANKKADTVIVSIFVNPTQFGPNEDLDNYPRNFKKDKKTAEMNGADIIFYPEKNKMYSPEHLTNVYVDSITEILCGSSRPDHFKGVTTVCAKLFNIVKPHFAVFGEKDFQQSVVIKQMVKDLNFDLDIITSPIIREDDGLAMSSRNTYLSSEERKDALSLFQSLRAAQKMIQNGEKNPDKLKDAITKIISSKKNTKIDYIQIIHPQTLNPLKQIKEQARIVIAVFVGKTRLIDNIAAEI